MNAERKEHWDKIHSAKKSIELSWYQEIPKTSINLIMEAALPKTAKIFDCGGGDSTLPDNLLKLGYDNITILDISEEAQKKAKLRMGKDAEKIKWIVADEAECCLRGEYDLWHDRAAFHFLTNTEEINNYIKTLKGCIKPGGYLIIATFSEDGPEKCSGIRVERYSEDKMTTLLKNSFDKVRCFYADHKTPFNTTQNFLFCLMRKR